jgi:hypothetical protein
MSAADTSYSLTSGRSISSGDSITVFKYLDIDSTYRNRNQYPNSNDFVVPINYPGRDSTAATAVDPVIKGVPYTGSTNPYGPQSGATAANPIGNILTSYTVLPPGTYAYSFGLDVSEPNIDNFYVNSWLQYNDEFVEILAYDGTTQTVYTNTTFSIPPVFPAPPGVVYYYYTRKEKPISLGTVAGVPTLNTVVISPTAPYSLSLSPNTYVNNYIRFTPQNNPVLFPYVLSPNENQVYRIISYDPSTFTFTISGSFNSLPVVSQLVEILSFSGDNASTLLFTGSGSSNVHSYYEIELLWLSVPNQSLNVGYGGTLDRYPYIYLRLYNEGNRLANQVFLSNNPNSTLAVFKIPVDEYFGNTSFITLTNSKAKQTIRFDPQSDLRFTLTLPDGTIIEYDNPDNFSPNIPDPFLQVNALFSLKKL